MQTIWQNSNYFNLSDPQPSWLFEIVFMSDAPGAEQNVKDLIPISISLPQYETVTVERYFMGTCKSAPINRKYAGDSDMSFYVRTVAADNEQLYTLGNVNQVPSPFQHLELDRTYNKIKVKIYSKVGEVETEYTYYNAIITALNFGEVAYEEEGMIQCTLSFHYDFWDKSGATAAEETVENDGMATAMSEAMDKIKQAGGVVG